MATATQPRHNVQQAVPFFWVTNIDRSLTFYVDGLGFEKTKQWAPDGKLRWCWLQLGGAAMMLQEFWREGPHTNRPESKTGIGVSICFTCEDALALYHAFIARGLAAKRPFVGNRMWVTEVTDPDGYQLLFESPTDAPEESEYNG